jgi:hypothetical protein
LKKFLVALAMTTSFLLCAVNSAQATADDLAVSVGAISWYNSFVPISRFEGIDAPHSSWGFMNGPTLKARYKDLYLEVTYLLSSNDYHLTNSTIEETKITSSASRSDVDVVLGYLLTPRIELNAGYKGIFVDDDLTLEAGGGTNAAKRDESYNLATLGVGVNIPLGTKSTFFLNGNALLGDFEYKVAYPAGVAFFTDADRHFLAWGVAADTSVTYEIVDNLSAGIGLRFQYIKAGTDNSSFIGPTSRLDYRF